MDGWKLRWSPSRWPRRFYCFSLALIVLACSSREGLQVASLLVPAAQTTLNHLAPNLAGSSARYEPYVGAVSSTPYVFRPHCHQIPSFRLCEGRSVASLEEGRDGDMGRASVNLNTVVTGANRGLGFALAARMARLGHRVVLTCRNEHEGRSALERLRVRGCARRVRFHRLDVTCARSLDSFRENCVHGTLGGRVDILFNNAAVCLPGSNRAVLEQTLAVNLYGALDVMEACFPTNTIIFSRPTVVWVSSGEGELCFLSSKWQELLGRAESLEEITSHLSELLSSSDGGEDSDSAAPSSSANSEIAFGQTPAYSISKAAVNAVVRALGPRLADECGVRLVAVCPGDVLTRMTSEEEVARGDGVSPEQAALDVVNVALRPADFPPGRFYRAGKEIDW